MSVGDHFKYYEKQFKKGDLKFYKQFTKYILSLPIPMSYEVWSGLHEYLDKINEQLEDLEKEL